MGHQNRSIWASSFKMGYPRCDIYICNLGHVDLQFGTFDLQFGTSDLQFGTSDLQFGTYDLQFGTFKRQFGTSKSVGFWDIAAF